jgi:hypothetical protein
MTGMAARGITWRRPRATVGPWLAHPGHHRLSLRAPRLCRPHADGHDLDPALRNAPFRATDPARRHCDRRSQAGAARRPDQRPCSQVRRRRSSFARSESHEAIETVSAEKVWIASLTLAMTPEVDRAPSIRSDRRPLWPLLCECAIALHDTHSRPSPRHESMIRKSGNRFFPRDKRYAFARRSRSIKEMRS